MNIAKRWLNYCDREVEYATEDDWNNFVLSIYTEWYARNVGSRSVALGGMPGETVELPDEQYSFSAFVQTSPDFQALCAVDSERTAALLVS